MINKWKFALFVLLTAGLNFSISFAYISLGLIFLYAVSVKLFGRDKKWIFEFSRTPLDFVFAGFIIVFLLSSFLGIDPLYSIARFKSEFIFVMFYFAYWGLTAAESKRILRIFVVLSAAAAAFGVFQYFLGLDPGTAGEAHKYLSLWAGRVKGSRSHPITYAECIFFGFIASVGLLFAADGFRKKSALILSALIHWSAILLSYSRGVWFGGLFSVLGIIILFFKKSKIYLIIIAAALLSSVFFISPKLHERAFSKNELSKQSNNVRLCLWQSGISIAADYPVFGVGPGNIKKVYQLYRQPNIPDNRNWSELHCMYLQMLAERGILGLGVFIWFLAVVFAMLAGFVKNSRDIFENALSKTVLAYFGGFLVFNFTENAFNDSEPQLIFYFIMGCAAALFLKKEGVKSE